MWPGMTDSLWVHVASPIPVLPYIEPPKVGNLTRLYDIEYRNYLLEKVRSMIDEVTLSRIQYIQV